MTDMAGAHNCIVLARMGMSEERLVIIASAVSPTDPSSSVNLRYLTTP